MTRFIFVSSFAFVVLGVCSSPSLWAKPPKEALEETTKVAFVETTLANAVSYLVSYHRVKIELDLGVRQDQPVSYRQMGKLKDVLQGLVASLDLKYEVDEEANAIVIMPLPGKPKSLPPTNEPITASEQQALDRLRRLGAGGGLIRQEGKPVWVISLSVDGLTNDDLSVLRDLPKLHTLDIRRKTSSDNRGEPTHTIVNDGFLEHLQGMSGLASLGLGSVSITDNGLGAIGKIRSLRRLDLSNVPISDSGLASVKTLSNLEWLGLVDVNVTDDGLRHLTKLPRLHRLILGATKVTDEGMSTLSECRSLRELRLRGQITDAGVRVIANTMLLKSLSLNQTQVSDAGLQSLASLQTLEKLSIYDSTVSDAGVLALRTASRLEHLSIESSKLSKDVLLAVQALKGLRHVTVDAAVSDAASKRFRDENPRVGLYIAGTR